jgi:cation:H+ antiporter
VNLGVALLFSIAGFFFLWKGADWLVGGASRMALGAKVSPIIIGITIVAFGTSLPEMSVSIAASLKGQPEITLGNVIGSNIANILLVLGIAAVIRPLEVSKRVVTRDTMLVLGSGVILLLLAMTGNLTRTMGFIMLAFFFAYLAYYARDAYMNREETEKTPAGDMSFGIALFMLAAGIICILLGADILVDSAVFIAQEVGISPAVIGLTMIAIGTSLPELATSAVASKRGESDISVGNVLGSNVFNTLLVLGLSAFMVGSIAVSSVMMWDILLMTIVCLFLVPTLWTGHKLTRIEGAVMLVIYVIYITSLAWRGSLV